MQAGPVKTLLNIIWLVLAGIVCCILIITIPFGIASFRMASYALWPFGRTVVDKPTAGAFAVIGNIIWLVVAGWWLALGHIITGVVQAITIIGIPLALANWKMVPISLFPLGKQIVPSDRIMAAYGQ